MSGNNKPGLNRIPDLQKVTEIGNVTDRHIIGLSDVILTPTSEAMTRYADPVAGSDATGDGSIGNPYASYDRCELDIPYKIRHKVHIKLKAGAYTSTLKTVEHSIDPDGQYIVECVDPMTVIESGLPLSAVAEIGAWWQAHEWQSVAAGWVADEHRHRFALMTSGADTGSFAGIYKNTADKLILHGNTVYPVAPGDTFDIVEPSAVITSATGITFNLTANNTTPLVGTKRAQSGFAGIKFISTKVSAAVGDFVFGGTENPYRNYMFITGCMFLSTAHAGFSMGVINGGINDMDLMDPAAFDTAFFNNWTGAVFTAATDNNTALVKDTVYIGGSSVVVALCSRGKIEGGRSSMGGAVISYSAIGQWRPWQHPGCTITTCYIDTVVANRSAVRAFAGNLDLSICYVAVATDAIEAFEALTLVLGGNFEIAVGGVTGYALRAGACSRTMVKPGVGALPSAVTGDIIFEQAGAVAWPAAGASRTDGHGAFVSRE